MGRTSFASQAVAQFNEADRELNKVYQAALASITDRQERALFAAAQKAWIKYRDAEVALNSYSWPEGKGGLFRNTDLTKERTAYLRGFLTHSKQ